MGRERGGGRCGKDKALAEQLGDHQKLEGAKNRREGMYQTKRKKKQRKKEAAKMSYKKNPKQELKPSVATTASSPPRGFIEQDIRTSS